ncbi:hypothetical protein HK098_006961 [Nowakowskiella sp. JEL0407]|nr:hypothetical protein HK098_006961 [Nowakowskiella sp. JEL0407]
MFKRKLLGVIQIRDMSSLRNSVKPYQFQIGILTDQQFPKEIDTLIPEFFKSLRATIKNSEFKDNVRINLITERKDANEKGKKSIDVSRNNLNVLVFPLQRRFEDVSVENHTNIIDQLRNPDEHSLNPLERSILICTHETVDERCGCHGPQFLSKLQHHISNLRSNPHSQLSQSTIRLFEASHVGGHKFAVNAIVYPEGDWYGNLKESDVEEFVERVFVKGERWVEKFRGNMSGDVGLDGIDGVGDVTWKPILKERNSEQAINVCYQTPFSPSVKSYDLKIPIGKSLMATAVENNIPNIEATCEGKAECATCHVYISDKVFWEKLNKSQPVSEAEQDMLEYTIGRRKK